MQEKPRRITPRLRLSIPAEFIALGGRIPVVLYDLSATGAKILVPANEKLGQGFLRWMDYEVFAEPVWQEKRWCGIAFDRPISAGCLFATRTSAADVVKDAAGENQRHAAAFVKGDIRR